MGRDGRNAVEIARQEKNRWKKRALRAEATLGKVREYLRERESNTAGTARWIVGDVLAILDESPTERETPADEPIAKRLTHTYMGDCPDEVNGWESRDPECPACRALEEMVPDDRA